MKLIAIRLPYLILGLWTAFGLNILGTREVQAQGLVYVDADLAPVNGITNLAAADGSPLSITFNGTFSNPAADNLWDIRGPEDPTDPVMFPAENFGASPSGGGNQSIFAAGGRGEEDVKELVHTLTSANGISANTNYDVYAVYWSATNADWGVRAGFTSNPGGNTYFNRTGNAAVNPTTMATFPATAGTAAGSAVWTTPPGANSDPGLYTEGDTSGVFRQMYLAKIGSQVSNGSSQLRVYIDDLSTTSVESGNTSLRTWYDGLAFVAAGVEVTLQATIDRDTGELTLINNTSSTLNVKSYSVTSGAGSLDPVSWNTIAPGGNATDPNPWAVTTSTASELAEAETPTNDGFAFSGSLSLGNAWETSPYEDVQVALTLTDDSVVTLTPEFSGVVQTVPYSLGDFDTDGNIDLDDYALLITNMHTDVASLTAAQAHAVGDITGNSAVNYNDFIQFQTAFLAANNISLQAALQAVPEPSAFCLSAIVGVALATRRSRRQRGKKLAVTKDTLIKWNTQEKASMTSIRRLPLVAALLFVFGTSTSAQAVLLGLYDFENGFADSTSNLSDAFESEGAFPGSGATFTNGIALDPIRGSVFDLSGGGAGGNGSDGGLNLTLPVAGNSTGSWSLAMWMRTPENVVGYLFDNRNTAAGTTSAGNRLILNIGQSNQQAVSLFDGVAWRNPGTPDIDDNTWHHITWTYDGTADLLTGYVDGIAGTTPVDVAIGRDLLLENIELGNEGTGGGGGGQEGRLIDDVRIYNNALTAAEVLALVPNTKLTLRVDTTDGTVSIVNELADPVSLNYYELTSSGATGSLDAGAWMSIDDSEGNDPVGTGWDEAGGSDAKILSEANLSGMTMLNPTESIFLGAAFDTSVGNEDLSFSYGLPGMTNLTNGLVEYVTDDGLSVGTVDGDYDGDLDVDGADFLAWQQGEAPGGATPANLQVWEDNYGNGAAVAATSAVPEPASLLILGAGCAIVAARRRK